MTKNKLHAFIGAIASGVTGYIAYFIALPPNLQTGIMGDLISLAPSGWQPALAGSSKSFSMLLAMWAAYKLSKPTTPPPTPPPAP